MKLVMSCRFFPRTKKKSKNKKAGVKPLQVAVTLVKAIVGQPQKGHRDSVNARTQSTFPSNRVLPGNGQVVDPATPTYVLVHQSDR